MVGLVLHLYMEGVVVMPTTSKPYYNVRESANILKVCLLCIYSIVLLYADKCQLPQQRGPCRALIPRYFYDSNDQTCKRFFYGGCLGNANNFQSLTKCQNDCKRKNTILFLLSTIINIINTTIASDTDDKCLLPSDSGRCLAFIRRYFYDSSINRCKEFIYGGCEGNANNFLTLRDCQRECASML